MEPVRFEPTRHTPKRLTRTLGLPRSETGCIERTRAVLLGLVRAMVTTRDEDEFVALQEKYEESRCSS